MTGRKPDYPAAETHHTGASLFHKVIHRLCSESAARQCTAGTRISGKKKPVQGTGIKVRESYNFPRYRPEEEYIYNQLINPLAVNY